ncbi:MAG TPA: nuclear transport factor 2 family protein [Aequorivita sp.]|nr:nuclear transport factor 2 family protein [Aequorivita sp.]
MKKLLFLGLAIVLSVTACQKQEKRYTQQSPEIDTYKKSIEAYEKRDWEAMASHYADTAKIMNNVTEKNGQNLTELIATNKEDATIFSSWDFVDGESEYEMVVTDDGETWVNFWGLWQGTLKANNKMHEIPVHLTAQFIDGKIVKEFGYWDNSKILADMQAMQKAEESAAEESEMDGDKIPEGE